MKKIISYGPEILILLFCGVLLLCEISWKKGYHMDEMLSFELANAEFNPWIVPTQPQGRLAKFVESELRGDSAGKTFSNLIDILTDVVKNRGGSKLLSYRADVYEEPVWIDRETFVEYITVNETDDFNFLSVYFNVKDDNHPPLHFMVLHLVSSVFQEKCLPIMGCGINLVCVLGVMVLLMQLGRKLMQIFGLADLGRIVGDGAALVYGLSAGALATVLLIRMYAMLTFFCVVLLEIHVEKTFCSEGEKKGFLRDNKRLILVTVLGFWTQYFFLFYCLSLAAVTVVILWREKRKKELWIYVRSMVTAAVIGVTVFPFAISDVFSSGRGVEALQNLSEGFAGYGVRLTAFLQILAARIGTGCLILFGLMAAVSLVAWIKNRKKRAGSSGTGRRTGGLLAMLLIPATGYFLLAARMSPYLVDRYIMPVFPVVVLALTALCLGSTGFWLMAKNGESRGQKTVFISLLLLLTICQGIDRYHYPIPYFYSDYIQQETVAEQYADYPCICVYEGVGYYENLLEFTHYEKTLLVTTKELAERADTESISSLNRVVVLLKKKEDKQQVCHILAGYGLKPEEGLYSGRDEENDEVILFGRSEGE